jgi:hypothetical protein
MELLNERPMSDHQKKIFKEWSEHAIETEKKRIQKAAATRAALKERKRVVVTAEVTRGPLRRSRRIAALRFVTVSPSTTSPKSLPAEVPSAISAGSSSERPQLEDSTIR